jgi:hypothetical protein
MNYLVLILCFFATSCNEKPDAVLQSTNVEYKVDKLFTVDGCNVYRFYDDGSKYFTNCKGGVNYDVRHGKTTSHETTPTEVEENPDLGYK